MGMGKLGRRLLSAVLAAACLVLCIPQVLGMQSIQPGDLLSGGSFILAASYCVEGETVRYAMGTNLDRKLDAIVMEEGTPEAQLPVWTVAPEGDGVSLSAGGYYLGYGGDTYFAVSAEPYVWSVAEGEAGGILLCTAAGEAIGYNHNEGDGRFGVYDLSEAWDSQYQFELLAYRQDIPESPAETTQPAAPEEVPLPLGTSILWLKDQGVALSGKPDGSGFLTGTPVSEQEDRVTGYGPEDIWTVEAGEDGSVVLLQSGRRLSLPEEGTVPCWDGAHDRWELKAREDGTWLICSASRPDCCLIWNPVLRTWSAGGQAATDGAGFTFSPVEENALLPQASGVTASPGSGELYPAGAASVTLTTGTPGAEIYYALSADGVAYGSYTAYTQPICPETGFGELWIRAYASAPGFSDGPEEVYHFTERTSWYGFYFGQLHAHTDLSDGLGTVEEAFREASLVEGLDFLAVTDHSNSFDQDTLGQPEQDGSAVSQAWRRGREAAASVTDSSFVGIFGYEMTWNNGLGHISTFGTPGWASRDQEPYQDLDSALENYYNALASVSGSVSQFNHPGALYGDFRDFDGYSAEADRAVTLIEIFNSDAGDAYDAFVRALDKGWHLAPTCNQDNHSGSWGSADEGRTVVLAHMLTEASLLEGMKNYRVYATKDSDLKIWYTLDGNLMGTRLFDYGPEVTVQVTLTDATDPAAATLEVIGSGGSVAASCTISGSATLTLPSDSAYYFLRITQNDGDVAVTAPVWLEKDAPLEITGLAADSQLTTAGERQSFTVEINNRASGLSGAVVTVTDGSGTVIISETIGDLPGQSVTVWQFSHIFLQEGSQRLTVTVTAGGRTVTRELTVTVLPRSILSDVIVDGTHGAPVEAEQLIAVAENAQLRAHVETREITAQQLEHCTLLIIPAPRTEFSPDFLEMVADFAARGGDLLLCGASDAACPGTAQRMNALLRAVGSTMTLSDDTVYDPASNGGSPDLIFPERFNGESPWTAGIREGQVFRHGAGCSVNPGSGTWLVRAEDSTFSLDGDFNGLECSGETYREIRLDDSDAAKEVIYQLVKPAGSVCLMAAEETGAGTVFLAGGDFPFGENIRLSQDNAWDLPYSNRTILDNILNIPVRELQVTPIAQARAGEDGSVFLVEGYVTAGTANPNNRLPQTIYIQDDTAGIAVVPYTETGLELGTGVRVTGVVRRVNGDVRLEIGHLSVQEQPGKRIAPAAVDHQTAMDYAASGGLLVQVEGTVEDVTLTEDGFGVTGFTLTDGNGNMARVLVETPIRSGTTGLNALASIVSAGNRVQAAGLVYCSGETVLRVRDCDEVVLLWAPPKETVPPETATTAPAETAGPEPPAPPTNGNPETGDGFALEVLTASMALSLLAAGALIWKTRIRKGLQ